MLRTEVTRRRNRAERSGAAVSRQKIPDRSRRPASGTRPKVSSEALPAAILRNRRRKKRQQRFRRLFLPLLFCAVLLVLAGSSGIRHLIERQRSLAAFYENDLTDELNTALAKNPELADFVANYRNASPTATGGISDLEKEQPYPLFLQWDARWGYIPYGNSNIGLAGCGPTCLSMVIFSLTRNAQATPDAIASFAMDNGYYVDGIGTSWSLMTDAPVRFGLLSQSVPLDEAAMKSFLDQGGLLIASMGPGDFTDSGHFIVLYGCNDSGFLVNDPNSRIRSSQTWSFSSLSGQTVSLWGFSKAA